ncbi:hypothetical protein BD779DRAFT_1798854 [Infundibulicybe gibba]|nr:hypothetical protein BD779DRAFT_1798854 [Infundibulicybe gibba]
MADSPASDGFNLFIGALSLVTAISSTILCCRAFLPRVQMRLFVEIMAETKAMLLDADQKGLIQDESLREDFAAQVEQLEGLSTDLHDEICVARTQFEEHIAALKGLSRDVMQLVDRARYLRSWIAKNAEGKQKSWERIGIVQIFLSRQIGNPPTPPHQIRCQLLGRKKCHLRTLRLLMAANARHAQSTPIQKPDPYQKHILMFLFGDDSGDYSVHQVNGTLFIKIDFSEHSFRFHKNLNRQKDSNIHKSFMHQVNRIVTNGWRGPFAKRQTRVHYGSMGQSQNSDPDQSATRHP